MKHTAREADGKFSGDIIKRLTHQLSAKGVSNARAEAVASLQKHGVLFPGTEQLTPTGVHRQEIGAAERAKERAARQTGHHPSEYVYHGGRVSLRKR